MRRVSLLAAAAAAALAAVAKPCGNAFDCQLNGDCNVSTQTCECWPGWTGADCGQLDFAPAPTVHAFYRNDSASWGGSIAKDPATGQWTMFLAYILGHCGLNAWQPNSAIYKAVSSTDSPLGPYVNESMMLSWFSHNPTVSQHPDGATLLWHIGCGNSNSGFVTGCANGTTPPPPPPPPVKFSNGGRCLLPNGTFPCWKGGSGNSFEVCPLIVGDCASTGAEWSVEGSSFVSFDASPAAINLDCDKCVVGSITKLFGGGSAGTGITFNATSGQLQIDNCPGMCLSNGVATSANPPCGGGSEPWSPAQIHAVPCTSPDAMGWSKQSTGAPVTEEAAGSATASAWPAPCTDVNVLVSTTGFDGPWVQSGILQGNRFPFPYETDNPAPFVFPNGTVTVLFRSWHPSSNPNTTTPIGIARSDAGTWNTTYTLADAPIPVGPYGNASDPMYVPLEDPFQWRDTAGNFHALFHNMGACSDVGCHAFSADGYTWYLATSDPYTTTIAFADGSSRTYARRERPHLVFNQNGDPAFLSNGVQEEWGNGNDHSYTLVQPLNVAWP